MAKFCDIPLEILLDIIEWSLESSGDRRHRFLQLNNLSLVCRYLHAATVPNIFRKYRLQLREERDVDCPGPGPTCFLTGTSLLKWNEDAFHTRLDHLREKATFVRELRIVDFGQPVGRSIFIEWVDPEEENGPAPFDSALVPVLLGTLDTLSGVVSVVFEGTEEYPPSTNFPLGLWQWLSRLRPEKLSFDGHFVFPGSLEPFPSVRSLSLLASAEANRVIEVGPKPSLHVRCEADPQYCCDRSCALRSSTSLLGLKLRRKFYRGPVSKIFLNCIPLWKCWSSGSSTRPGYLSSTSISRRIHKPGS